MELLNKLKIYIRKKTDHELRFINILIALSDNNISWNFFRETLNFLCIPELTLIVEERNSKKKCGYILCDQGVIVNPIKNICCDITSRKIYDISNRKKFCSDWCYGAHKHICNQISNQPLWKQPNQSNKTFNLYSKMDLGCPGEIHSVFNLLERKDILTTSHDDLENKYKKPNERVQKVNNIIKELDKLIINKKDSLNKIQDEIEENNGKNEGSDANHEECLNNFQINVATESENEILQHIQNSANNIISWTTERTWDYLKTSFNHKSDDDNSSDHLTKIENEIAVIPQQDSINHNFIRQSILMNRFKNIAVTVLEDFGVDQTRFLKEVNKYLSTCRLTSKSVIFNTCETQWLIILLIDLLLPQHAKCIDECSLLSQYGLTQPNLYMDVLRKLKIPNVDDERNRVSSRGDNEY